MTIDESAWAHIAKSSVDERLSYSVGLAGVGESPTYRSSR